MSVRERRERERAQRHQLIITSARELAEAEGWDAVTTRRLSERIEYSQPVLYQHFAGKEAIMTAVALEGFAELAGELRTARESAALPHTALRALADTYLNFAADKPALYDAMFVLSSELAFGEPDTLTPLRSAFAEFTAVVTPLAGDSDPETLAEVLWSSLHGLATLTRGHRLRPEHHEARVKLALERFADYSS
jgi:AcrR family transcriptional regulator